MVLHLNTPLLVVSYFMLGPQHDDSYARQRRSVTLFIRVLPQSQLLSDDPIMNAVFGGGLASNRFGDHDSFRSLRPADSTSSPSSGKVHEQLRRRLLVFDEYDD